MDKGFVIIAQNTDLVNYVQCAEQLAESIIRVMPDAKVSLISDDKTNCKAFHKVISYRMEIKHQIQIGNLSTIGKYMKHLHINTQSS